MVLIWQEVDHPEYFKYKGTRVRGYDFSERQSDGGLLGLVLNFESGSELPVRREIEELTGLEVAVTYITTNDGVGVDAVNEFKMRAYGKVFFVYLEQEVDFDIHQLVSGKPTGRCRLVLNKKPRLDGDLPRRPGMQTQLRLEDF